MTIKRKRKRSLELNLRRYTGEAAEKNYTKMFFREMAAAREYISSVIFLGHHAIDWSRGGPRKIH